MKSKPTSVSILEIFGTQCYIDEMTEIVHCNYTKEDNLKGFDWTIIYYFFIWLIKKRFTWWIVIGKTRVIVPRSKHGMICQLTSTVG
jgi:hypothetical protein